MFSSGYWHFVNARVPTNQGSLRNEKSWHDIQYFIQLWMLEKRMCQLFLNLSLCCHYFWKFCQIITSHKTQEHENITKHQIWEFSYLEGIGCPQSWLQSILYFLTTTKLWMNVSTLQNYAYGSEFGCTLDKSLSTGLSFPGIYGFFHVHVYKTHDYLILVQKLKPFLNPKVDRMRQILPSR